MKGPDVETIHEAARRGVSEDGLAGGKENLEDLGLDVGGSSSSDFDLGETPKVPQKRASAQYTYGDPTEGEGELHVLHTGAGSVYRGDVIISVTMDLEGCSPAVRNSWWIDDGIGVGFNPKDWGIVGEPEVSADYPHTGHFTSSNVADDALAGTIDINLEDDRGVGGCSAFAPPSAATLTGNFKARSTDVVSSLWGSYEHTFSPTPGDSINSISGGAGGISLGLGYSGGTAWSIAEPVDVSEWV